MRSLLLIVVLGFSLATNTNGSTYFPITGNDCTGNDIIPMGYDTPQPTCQSECDSRSNCMAYVYDTSPVHDDSYSGHTFGICFLKSSCTPQTYPTSARTIYVRAYVPTPAPTTPIPTTSVPSQIPTNKPSPIPTALPTSFYSTTPGDCPGNDLVSYGNYTLFQCSTACDAMSSCFAYVFCTLCGSFVNNCMLKSACAAPYVRRDIYYKNAFAPSPSPSTTKPSPNPTTASPTLAPSTCSCNEFVVNGGFENGYTGWTGFNPNVYSDVFISGSFNYPAHDGNYFAGFGAQYLLHEIYQNVYVNAGYNYILKLWVIDTGNAKNELQVWVDNGLLLDVSYGYSTNGWISYHYPFVANANIITVKLYAKDGSWMGVDSVSVRQACCPNAPTAAPSTAAPSIAPSVAPSKPTPQPSVAPSSPTNAPTSASPFIPITSTDG